MTTDKPGSLKLFYASPIDAKEELEERLDKCRTLLQRVVGLGSEREAHDALQNTVCQNKQTHDDICLGFLANILTEPMVAPKAFCDLTLITRDNLLAVTDMMTLIVADKYHKLTDTVRTQMIWIVKELVRAKFNCEIVCWNLLRQIAGGDITNRNLWLAENMLEIFMENRPWLDKYPVLIGSVIFTYLRILEDHFPQHLASLRQKEINFVVNLIRDYFSTVVVNPAVGMGRDFVRLLQGVSRIPEIQALWCDLFYNPKALSPHYTGVAQLLSIRTSRKFLQCRLTPEMEKKIAFLTTYVKFGLHRRYQDWFQRQFLATPESQTLRADIIRFIVCVIHPSNEILCSDILPRWAVIGWLLTTCTSPVAAANAKLALFFDWLTYDPARDNIMNIEPGILVMFHSIKPHLAITATLIDFLIRQIQEFWPGGSDKIKDGISAAFRTIQDKKVLASLDVVLDHPKLELELRNAIKGVLMPLIKRETDSSPLNNNGHGMAFNETNEMGSAAFSTPQTPNSAESQPPFTTPIVDLEAEFSDEDNDNEDDEDDIQEVDIRPILGSSATQSRGSPTTLGSNSDEAERFKVLDIVSTLPPNLRLPLGSLLNNPSEDKRESLDEVIEECSSMQMEKEHREAIVRALVHIYRSELISPCVNEEDNCLIIENVCASPVMELILPLLANKPTNQTLKSKNLLKILADVLRAVPRVGYKVLLVLHHLNSDLEGPSTKEEYYPTLYKNLCVTRGLTQGKTVEQGILLDVKACWETEPIAVGYLCSPLYCWFESECLDNTDILRMIVSTIDSSQLQDIVWKIAQNDFVMFTAHDIVNTISKTLDWETWEQHCVWTILDSHQFDIEDYLPIVPMLDFRNNAEALTAVFLKLKGERPSERILGPCLCRKTHLRDRFVVSLLICWSDEKEKKNALAEVLTSLLVKAYGTPGKRKRGTAGGNRGGTASPAGPVTPSIEFVLAHLDQHRSFVGDDGIFNTDTMQAALLQVQSWVTETQRNRYKDLLALAAIEESSEIKESRSVVKRSASGRKLPSSPTGSVGVSIGASTGGNNNPPSNPPVSSSSLSSNLSRTRSGRTTRQPNLKDDSESSSNDEDEEVISRPRNAKKRRKTSALNSDSD